MRISKATPFKWPFPPGAPGKSPAPKKVGRSRKAAVRVPVHRDKPSVLADVVMVVFWGASIPGFMWLGAVVGF